MIDLVTLDAAKTHLRIDGTDHDFDIAMKVTQASAIVMTFYKKTAVPDEWILNSSPIVYDIPADIQAATLLVISELFENRESGVANVFSETVKNLIPRDPTLA